MARKVAFLYGFAEGPLHSRKFAKLLQSSGYTVIRETDNADIVIAHSAGSYYVPQLHDQQLLVLINPTYWPGKRRTTRAINRIRYDLLHILPSRQGPYLLLKTSWNFFYIVKDFRRTSDIIRRSKHFRLQASLRQHRTILIRNNGDPWLSPDIEHLKQPGKSLRIHHLDGDHDNCWLHPQAYINLLQSDI